MKAMNSTRSTRARLSRTIAGLLVLLAPAGAVVAQPVQLQAISTTRDILGETITFWVFDAYLGTAPDPVDLARRVPGPEIVVASGDGLTIELTNNLTEPTSVYIPGQKPPVVQEESSPGAWTDLGTQGVTRTLDGRIRSLTQETPAGGTRRYLWSDLRPGTYLYQSGTHMSVQVQMGLYGVVTKDSSATEVYPDREVAGQATVVYSEIDFGLHAAVADGTYGTDAFPTTIDYLPTYFLINGELHNDPEAGDPTGRPAALTTATAGTTLLLRLVNAGLKTRLPTLLGGHYDVIAEDGVPYPYAKTQYSVILPAGKTKDLLLTVPGPAGKKLPLFDRRLYRTLGSSAGGANGGQIVYIRTQ